MGIKKEWIILVIQNSTLPFCIAQYKNMDLILFIRGRKIYEPPRYMSVNTAAEQLLEIIEKRQKNGEKDIGMLSLYFEIHRSKTSTSPSELLEIFVKYIFES